MQNVYFTRHGETVWNVENKICGVTDIALTDRGREQARALGRQLAAGEQGITRILCSPLVRARETAQLIAAETGLPLAVDVRLREQAFGRYEGTPRNGPAFALAKLHFADRFGGGESMMQLAARVYSLLDELAARQDGPVGIRPVRHRELPAGEVYLRRAEAGITFFFTKNIQTHGVCDHYCWHDHLLCCLRCQPDCH